MGKRAEMTIFDNYTVDLQDSAHLGKWFLVAGGFGLAIAILLAVAMGYDRAPTAVVFALWPTAMLQLIDPQTIGSKIATALFVYGGNFLIYGLLGVGVGLLVSRLRLLFKRRS
jgi:hypothetical protein